MLKQKAKLKELFEKNSKKVLRVEPIVGNSSNSPVSSAAISPARRTNTVYEWIAAFIVQILSYLTSKLALVNRMER